MAVFRVRRLLTVDELAAQARIDPHIVRRDIALGELRAVHVGKRCVRVPHETARTYLRTSLGVQLRRLAVLDRRSPVIDILPTGLYRNGAVALVLNVTAQHVRNLQRERRLSYMRVGAQTAVIGQQLIDFLSSL